jgi:hypothetical protein
MFVFHHRRADLHFSWDGWMQVRVRAGTNLTRGLFPDRFDIREPDLRDPSRHPMHPTDGSVHFVPETPGGVRGSARHLVARRRDLRRRPGLRH